MIDSYFRSYYQHICVEPVLPLFTRFPPRTVTLTSCLVGLGVCPLLYYRFPILALTALVISAYLDTLDGSLARRLQLTSPQGAALDIVCDRVVEFAVILGLLLVDIDERALPCVLMLGSILLCVTSFLVVGVFTANQSSKSFFYSPGLIERSEAFMFFSVLIMFPAIFFVTSLLFAALTCFTAVFRLMQFCRT